MKKMTALTLVTLLLCSMTSFVGAEAAEGILIAYFTMPEVDGVDAVSGASRVVEEGEVIGNVQYIANAIAQETGGDLFAIETVQVYPAQHDALTAFARDEQGRNARPELSTQIENPGDYDTIFLGYPNWWADLPMPLYTFLETYDLSGKTIIPFCPHGGSGFSNTVNAIAQLQPSADVRTDGFAISRNDVPGSVDKVLAWLESIQ